METKHKELYESPMADVVEVKMETGILNASANAPENRGDGGLWGTGDWY